MITLNLKNLKEFGIKFDEKEIPGLLKKIHSRKQGFYTFTDEKFTIPKYKDVVVLGIGGSALGITCLMQSLKPFCENLHVLDNIDPILIKKLEKKITYSKTLFIVISKSGTTLETMAHYFYFKKKAKHFVFITDPEEGHLREIAKKEKIPTFDIPKNLSGRFSVLSPVGLLPAQLIGINTKKLLHGAETMREKFLSENLKENLCYQFAKTQYQLYKKGKNINVIMPYADQLKGLADWYRQLLAESIGKTQQVGITPVNALGVTDQHSQLQLYLDGPKDKLVIFMDVKNRSTDFPLPNPIHKDITFGKLLQIEKDATAKILTKKHRPNLTIALDSISEESIGQILMFFMGSVAFLGELFRINAYNQPAVDLPKRLAKETILKL